jgi:HSP20 family molecular chaperone IbpA
MTKYVPAYLEEFEPLTSLLNNFAAIQSSSRNESGVSIGETDDSVFVEVPVPGIQRDKIHLTYEKGSILIKAEEEEDKTDVRYHVKSSRRYAYRVGIPARVDEQAAPEAHLKDGILKIKFHKSRAARPIKIDIKS